MAVTSPADFNLFDPAVMECPFPFYEALRREAPVYEVPGFGMYLVSRFDDIVDALRAPEVFSSDLARAATGSLVGMFSPPPSEEIDEILAKGYPPTNTLLTNDPPSHTRYRALVSKAFAPRRVKVWLQPFDTPAAAFEAMFAALTALARLAAKKRPTAAG